MRMALRDFYVGMFGHMFVELSGMNYEGLFLDEVCHFDFSKAPLPHLQTACDLECKTLSCRSNIISVCFLFLWSWFNPLNLEVNVFFYKSCLVHDDYTQQQNSYHDRGHDTLMGKLLCMYEHKTAWPFGF